MIEAGFAWLPHVMWRMDKDWKGLRDETPWLKRLPSEYIVDHVRFTSQPIYEPAKTSHLLDMMEIAQADKVLMFSSDYPHWDADAPNEVYRRIPAELNRQFTHDNPGDFFRL